jgi:hypothetical protein
MCDERRAADGGGSTCDCGHRVATDEEQREAAHEV